MIRDRLTALSIATVMLAALAAGADEPPALANWRAAGAEITDIGDLPRPPEKPSVHCYVATKDGKAVPFCTTLDKKLIVPIGPDQVIFDGTTGLNLTAKLLEDAKIGILTPSGTAAAVPGTSEQMLTELQLAHGFTFGNQAAPEIYLVADPLCPYCRATWADLQKPLAEGRIKVKLVPVAEIRPESLPLAGMLFEVQDPTNSWIQFEAGRADALAGSPGENSMAALLDNHNLFKKWDMVKVPFIAYRGTNGKVRVVRGYGEPNPAENNPGSIGAILLDLPKHG